MEKLKRISSKNKDQFIDVVQVENGYYLLQKFVQKYDFEEKQNYEVREHPDPSGRFGDLDTAVLEANRLLGNLS